MKGCEEMASGRERERPAHALGAFVIAELDDSPPVVCLETAAEGETLEDSATVAIVMLTFDNLRSKALPDEASREVIMKVAEERWI